MSRHIYNELKMVHRNSLSCEAILRRTPKGDLIIVSQCGGAWEPCKENREYIFRSTDNGKTWSAPIKLYDDGRAIYATEVYIYKDEIWIFMIAHNGKFLDYENFILVSKDDGITFEKRPHISSKTGFMFVRSGIEVDDKLIFSYHYYEVSKEENDKLKAEDKYVFNSQTKYAHSGTLTSTDGINFVEEKVGVDYPMTEKGKWVWKWSEPSIVHTEGTNLVMLMRVDGKGVLYRSDSSDLGQTWSMPIKTKIPNPNNKPKLIKMNDKSIALLNTPNKVAKVNAIAERSPLCVWISDDNLATFSYKKVISDFAGWLSYPDGIYDAEKNEFLLSFELNRHDVYFARHSVKR